MRPIESFYTPPQDAVYRVPIVHVFMRPTRNCPQSHLQHRSCSQKAIRDRMKPDTTPMPWTTTRPPPKTSSERGRNFRARQRERAAVVERAVTALREEIRSLTVTHALLNERLLRSPSSREGSNQHTIRQFFTLFRDGLPAHVVPTVGDSRSIHQAERVRFLEDYMRSVFDPDTVTGDMSGVDVVIDQWRRYTVLHGRFHLDIGHIDAIGPEEDREFHLHVKFVTSRPEHWTTHELVD